MFSRLLVVGLIGGAGVGGLLGQAASGSTSPPDWSTLVGGAIGGVPAATVLFWRLHLADRDNAELREEMRNRDERHSDEMRSTNDKTLALAERALPALVEATRAITDVKAALEGRHPAASNDLDRLVRRLEGLADELGQRRS